jgi:Ca2+-binding EF-hand superfamily protein
MKHATWIIASLGFLTASSTLAADINTKKSPAEIEKHAAERFKKSDTNNDGAISKEEFLARSEKRFNEIDTDHDGKISPKEMKTYRDAKQAKRAKRLAEKEKEEKSTLKK